MNEHSDLLNEIEAKLKSKVENKIFTKVSEYVDMALDSKHYEKLNVNNPYDISSILKQTGKLNKDIDFETVGDLLNQFTGDLGYGHRRFYQDLERDVEDIVFDEFNSIFKEMLTNNQKSFKKFVLNNHYTIQDYIEMVSEPHDILIDSDFLGIDEIWEIKNNLSMEKVAEYYEMELSEFLKKDRIKKELATKGSKIIKNAMKNARVKPQISVNLPKQPNFNRSKSKKIGFKYEGEGGE